MIKEKILQVLQNNLLHGEQKRGAFTRFFGVHSLMSPDTSRPWGTDISPWDGNVRLDVTQSLGASFTFIKAIDGTLTARYFVENRQRAVNAKVVHGAYGWLYRDANVSCVAQAQAFDALLKRYPVDLPAVIDFEPTTWAGQASNPNYTDLRKWVTEFLRLGNRKPILYSAAYFMNPQGTMPADLKAMFAGLWVAHYGTVNPTMPNGYAAGEWLFHQFTSSGDAKVYSPNDVNKLEVDMNYCISKQRLYELADIVPPNGGTMLYGKVTATSLYTRSGPGTNYPIVGNGLFKDDVVIASEQSGGWWHLTEINGKPVTDPNLWASGTYIEPTAPPVQEPSILVSHIFDDTLVVDGKEYTAHFEVPNVEYKPKA